MKWAPQLWLCWCLLICLLWGETLCDSGDPYKILGVHRKSSQQEIRKAYKQLAKEWHPDKSSQTNAEEKFVEIKQAYELLSDPDRRRLYDDRGITEDDFYKKTEHPPFESHKIFEDLFSQHGGYFNFQENDITFFHKLSITTRQYDKLIVPKSERTPHLIFFYTDWCFPCLQTAPYCRKLVDYLEPLGINFVTLHSGREPSLTRRLSVHTHPCLVLLLDGNVYIYKESITSLQKIVEFVKSKLPYKLVPTIGLENLSDFLNGWRDNRVRGLIFEPKQNLRLRYLVTAFHFRHRVAFGFVNSDEIRKKYQVPDDMDTILLFNENTTYPMASVTMKDIPTATLHQIVSSNQYLALPRLSSQGILEALCPCEWHKPKKKLCAVLITEASEANDPHRESFRIYAQRSPYNNDKVRFAYIYHEVQSEFINALIPENQSLEPLLSIVILWRRDTSHIKYEWVAAKWEVERNLNDTTSKLENTIGRLLRTSEALAYEAFVKDLFDEHSKTFIAKAINKAVQFFEKFYEGLDKESVLPALSILGTILFILAVGYLMAYLVALEEENIQKQKAKAKLGNNNNDSSSSVYQPELRLHELRSEKYNGLIMMLKPGCRTIVVILDMESRQQLIPPFHKAVWPYRKNKTLMFAYMYIERGISWYKDLLELSLPGERELNINPRNCVGTVLALNGHRKYFCVFHAKHTEQKRKGTRKLKKSADKDCESGSFIGFDSSGSESDSEPVLLQGNLLDGLPNWLDRLFEGTTQRYHVNYWPDFPVK